MGAEAPLEDIPRRAAELRVAQIAAQLNHPHVAAVHDFAIASVDGAVSAFLVMELVDGVPLSERLPGSPLSPSEIIEKGAQVAETLVAAHRIGIALTNISPANVMLTAAGVKILNFGLVEAGSGAHQRESGIGRRLE